MGKRKRKTGMSPGSIVYTGHKEKVHSNVTVVQYNEQTHQQFLLSANDFPKPDTELITWYDVRGLSDTQLIEDIGNYFGIHPLALEDVVDPMQRPKTNDFENGLLLIMKALMWEKEGASIRIEQVSIFVTHNTIITFQEFEDDLFPEIRKRIGNVLSRHRKRSADYLAYSILDLIVDQYYLILDELDELLNVTESQILYNARPAQKSILHHLKGEILQMRRTVAPSREAIARFYRIESPYIDNTTDIYLRDLQDHITQILDAIDLHRETLYTLHDLYNSEIASRTNSIMQVLTIISTIFIPLTFIVGVYGMNFDNMPELHWVNGYYAIWGFMCIVAVVMLIYFRGKKWL